MGGRTTRKGDDRLEMEVKRKRGCERRGLVEWVGSGICSLL